MKICRKLGILTVTVMMVLTLIPAAVSYADTTDQTDQSVIDADTTGQSVSDEYVIPDAIKDNNIPVVYLDIDQEEFDKVISADAHSYTAETGTVSILVPDGYTGEYSETEQTDMTDLALEYIRGRGNSTWEVQKKPFKIKLDKKADILGMGKNAHWVLLANAYDPTLIRNRVAYYIGSRLGLPYTPKSAAVDFVVNGNYLGSYTIGHDVRVDTTRVNIDKLTEADNEEPEVTGGYLLRMNPKMSEAEENCINTEKNVSFGTDTPAFDADSTGTAAQKTYITNYLQTVEDAIFSDEEEEGSGSADYTEYMDLESAAKYWLMQEFLNNGDAFNTDSTFLYKVRGGKLYWGPMWDFDLAARYNDMFSMSTSGFLNTASMPWLDHMRAYDPAYQQMIRSCWKDMDSIITDVVKEGGIIDQYKAELSGSWETDKAIGYEDESGSDGDLDSACEDLRSFYTERQTWFDQNIDTDELTNVFCTITYTINGEVLKTAQIRRGTEETLIEIPSGEESYTEGYLITGWVKENGEELSDENKIYEDMTVVAVTVPEAEAITTEAIYPEADELWLDITEEIYQIEYSLVPDNTQDTLVTWTSSDPDVVDIEDDHLRLKETGEAVVTGSTVTGTKCSVTVHVYDPEETSLQTPTDMIIENPEITVTPGEYVRIRCSLTPQPAKGYVYYTSGNETVATVDNFGVVKGISPGTCTITVKDTNELFSKTCKVTVADDTDAVSAAEAELSEMIIQAKKDLADREYTEESAAKLTAAIAEANELLDKTHVTMREVRVARTKLLRAWRLLEPADDTADEADKEYHEAVDALAQTLIDVYSKVSASAYTSTTYSALKKACTAADKVLEDESSTPAELRQARTKVLKAWKSLKKKAANKLSVKGKTVKVKYKKLKKKAQKLAVAKVIKFRNKGQGTLTYSKVSGNKKIKINAKTGKVTIKKGLKKGTYKVKVKVKAAGNGNYKAATKTVTFKIKVK